MRLTSKVGFKKGLVLVSIVLVFFSLFATAFLLNRSKSIIPEKSQAVGVRGTAGDFWADVVIGQPDFTEGSPKEKVANKVFNPGGVLIDRSIKPNRVYVADSGNSRILVYKSLGKCSNSSTTMCTDDSDCTSGGVCNLISNKNADMVIGQPNFSSGACNGDATFTTYPTAAPATNTSLCLSPQGQISPLEGGNTISMASDANSNFYVPDSMNNRVLMFKNPLGAVSGGAGDKTADAVWGQSNFAGTQCNRGLSPTASSLCFGIIDHNSGFASGVDIDTAGNLWVSDSINNRVLRFPYNATLGRPADSADLVLGQPGFTSNTTGLGLNQMTEPGAVNVHPNGTVFVLDTYFPHSDPSGSAREWSDAGRVLKFAPTFTNGMNATSWGDPSKPFKLPYGIEFSLDGNSVWISDLMNNMVEQWNLAGTSILNVLYKDRWEYETGYQGLPCSVPNTDCYQEGTGGSIGMTSKGDLFLSAKGSWQSVARFKDPIRALTQGSLTSADYKMFPLQSQYPQPNDNLLTGKSFGSPIGVEAVGDQLIVSDNWRLMFWNSANTSSLTNFKLASGIIVPAGTTSSGDYVDPHSYGRIRADSATPVKHLYVLHNNQIEIFDLPLTTTSVPRYKIGSNSATGTIQLKDLNGANVDIFKNFLPPYDDLGANGLFPAPDGSYLWVAHSMSNRVFRIRNPLSADPRVDFILGQTNSTNKNCNLDGVIVDGTPTDTTLCLPSTVTMDKLGNLYVSDAGGQDGNQGNMRLLKFNAAKITPNNTTMKYAVTPDNIWFYVSRTNRRNVIEPAFDPLDSSNKRMVVGYNPYNFANSKHSIEYYDDISTTPASTMPVPSGVFNDFIMFPQSMDFDENGNLYVVDMNRFRVLKYLTPLGPPSTTPPASGPYSCNTDCDCTCGIYQNDCAYVNKNYSEGECMAPDFCNGFSGNGDVACVNNVCTFRNSYTNNCTGTPKPTGYIQVGCIRAGCSSEICKDPADPGGFTNCIADPKYACYNSARCERQGNGLCGWTQTTQLRACLTAPAPTTTVSASVPTPVPTSAGIPTLTSIPTFTPTPTLVPVSITNLLVNPGFEIDTNKDSRPDNWTSNGLFTKSTTSVHGGKYAGRHFSTYNKSYNINQTVKNIQSSTPYTFSGWFDIPKTSDTFKYKIELKWRNALGITIRTDTIKTYTTSTSGWTRAFATKTSPSSARSVVVRMSTSSLRGPIYVDDFSLNR